MVSTRTSALILMVLAAAATRLLPHPPNLTSITALALFGGACFPDRRLAFAVPLLALMVSDLTLAAVGSWQAMIVDAHIEVQYLAFALVVVLGCAMGRARRVGRIAGFTLASSTLFFLASNFGVWLLQSMYPKSGAGLVACYVAALPFWRNALLGDLIFAAVLFGGLRLLEQRFDALREPAPRMRAG
jgi:hypothetical protein